MDAGKGLSTAASMSFQARTPRRFWYLAPRGLARDQIPAAWSGSDRTAVAARTKVRRAWALASHTAPLTTARRGDPQAFSAEEPCSRKRVAISIVPAVSSTGTSLRAKAAEQDLISRDGARGREPIRSSEERRPRWRLTGRSSRKGLTVVTHCLVIAYGCIDASTQATACSRGMSAGCLSLVEVMSAPRAADELPPWRD
jgi:hypothetical protein